MRRTIPVIEQLAKRIDVPISIDTTKSKVAEESLNVGATIVNDISGLTFDEQMISVVAKAKASLVVMHIQGNPKTMQQHPQYENVVEEVKEELAQKLDDYISYMAEEWVKDNQIAIEKGLRAEIVEDFIGGLKNLFVEHYIDIPEDKVDVVEELSEKVVDLEAQLNEQIQFGIELKKELNESSLYSYLQLNYIPAPQTIFRNIRKMQAGTCMTIKLKNRVVKNFTSTDLEHQYYKLPIQEPGLLPDFTYDAACERLSRLMHDAVERRLISDVPLGAFLSGGLDSSVIAGLASQYTKHLNTFSIGFKDEPFFDETRYANAVAKMHGTNHTVFNISNNDLFEVLHDVLDYLDEPFADSSALNVFILSRETRKHVTVALSGDGADEIFGGYNKHRAEWLIRNDAAFVRKAKLTSSLLKPFAGSRNSKIGNKIRQVHRFAFGSNLNAADRTGAGVLLWASVMLSGLYTLMHGNLSTTDKLKRPC